MATVTKSPTTRVLALIALCLAMGALSLRALDLFSSPSQTEAPQSAIERSLVNLLEPITGYGNVRVSVHDNQTRRAFFVLINDSEGGVAANARLHQIEEIIAAATGLDSALDTLTISQVPFAAGTGPTLSPLELSEIIVLALICVCLTGLLIRPYFAISSVEQSAAQALEPRSPAQRPLHASPTPIRADDEVEQAAEIAVNDPAGTAQLIRQWMGKGGHA